MIVVARAVQVDVVPGPPGETPHLQGQVDLLLLLRAEVVRQALAPAGPALRVVGPVHPAPREVPVAAGAAGRQRLATMNTTFPSSANPPRQSRG